MVEGWGWEVEEGLGLEVAEVAETDWGWAVEAVALGMVVAVDWAALEVVGRVARVVDSVEKGLDWAAAVRARAGSDSAVQDLEGARWAAG